MRMIFTAALIALATGCTITGANRRSLDGQNDWSSHGVAVLESPADGYQKTAQADAALLFAQQVAAQRTAIVAGAYAAAAGGGRDVAARKEIKRVRKAVASLAGTVAEITVANGGADGGVR